MTKILFYTKETETRGRCHAIHNQPHLLTEEQKKQGIEVENVPEKPQTGRGEMAVRYVNLKTGRVWHKKVERKLNETERMEILEEKIDQIKVDIEEIKKK